MPHNASKKHPRDESRIDVHELGELEYWCKALKVSKEELIAAVKVAGNSAKTVRRYLWR